MCACVWGGGKNYQQSPQYNLLNSKSQRSLIFFVLPNKKPATDLILRLLLTGPISYEPWNYLNTNEHILVFCVYNTWQWLCAVQCIHNTYTKVDHILSYHISYNHKITWFGSGIVLEYLRVKQLKSLTCWLTQLERPWRMICDETFDSRCTYLRVCSVANRWQIWKLTPNWLDFLDWHPFS